MEWNSDFKFSKITPGKNLGRGAFGSVFAATIDGNTYAVKALGSNNAIKDTIREVDSLRTLQHENIMKLYALSTDEFDSLHLVMEFMPGGCLHSLLENKDIPIPFEQAFGYIQQSAAAISYIHSQGKLHRDIKPLNMLLSADQRVLKLGDFGSVRDLQNSMTSQKGTVLYMAPEVFNGKHYNEKCDVYSWAISMWHVLSRLIPFINFNLRNLMKAIQNGERPKLEDISYVECTDRLKQLIASCWQGEASIRPAMSDVLVTLESCR